MSVLRLDQILGQPETIDFLKGVVERGRFANAYLLHGPPGVGKGSAALAFARAMLCEGGATPSRIRGPEPPAKPLAPAEPSLFAPPVEAAAPAPPKPEPLGPPGDACGRCTACIKTADLQHPDLKFLFPVSGEERTLEETIVQTLDAWREDPFFVFQYEKAASIRLSMTRELLREMAYKPFEADHRVVVVRDADRMREDQFSAMLKSIEEPGATTVWVLTTSRPTRLPATIRSRCQRVRFRALPETLIETYLRERIGADERTARMVAALSAGSLGRALMLRDSDPKQTRDDSLALLAPARRGDYSALWIAAAAAGRPGKGGRETLRRMVEFQMLWQRDLLRARYGSERERLVHRDREAELRAEAARVDATEVRRRLMILEELLRSVEGNISPEASVFSAQLRIAEPSRSRTDWPKHPIDRWEY